MKPEVGGNADKTKLKFVGVLNERTFRELERQDAQEICWVKSATHSSKHKLYCPYVPSCNISSMYICGIPGFLQFIRHTQNKCSGNYLEYSDLLQAFRQTSCEHRCQMSESKVLNY